MIREAMAEVTPGSASSLLFGALLMSTGSLWGS